MSASTPEGAHASGGRHGRRFGSAELPPEIARAAHRAVVLEWVSIGILTVTITLMAVVMGSSQAMRTAWIEDLLSLVPPLAFLVALRITRRHPSRRHPYGAHRSVGMGHLVAAVALAVMGAVLLVDGALNLLKGEHPPIGTFDVFGHTVWQGWFMVAVMAVTSIPPIILGRRKMRLAEQLHDRVLYADADMNKADWQTGLATIVGVLGIGLGWWWADAAAAMVVAVGIVKDGVTNLRTAVTDLADARATTIGGDRPHPLIDRAERLAWAEPWVRHAGARVRDQGHVLHMELFVVPEHGADVTVGRCHALHDAVAALDWKLEDVVVVPVAALPDEVHGGESGEQGGAER